MFQKLLKRKQKNNLPEMSFIDHLEELRWHIMRSVLAILICAIVFFIYIDWIFDNIIAGPIQNDFITYKLLCQLSHQLHIGDALCMPPIKVTMQTTAFGGQFISSISIALVGGFICAFPYIFWELWRFIKPALSPKELKHSRGIIFWISFFFFLGAAFGYFLLGPFTFNFLTNYKIGMAQLIETKPTLNDYIENLTDLIIGCGIAFELPVLSYALTKIGLITPNFLREYRKYAVVSILVVAAVITPSPDWMSQMIVFVPLFILYELSIIVSAKAFKYDKEEEEKEWS